MGVFLVSVFNEEKVVTHKWFLYFSLFKIPYNHLGQHLVSFSDSIHRDPLVIYCEPLGGGLKVGLPRIANTW